MIHAVGFAYVFALVSSRARVLVVPHVIDYHVEIRTFRLLIAAPGSEVRFIQCVSRGSPRVNNL